MKMLIKNERGVSLISLAVAIIILGIIVSMLVYNVKDTKEIEKLTNMYTDIDNIGDRISNYYSRYGALPILKDVDLSSNTTINKWISEKGTDNSPLGANDTNIFYVIDLKALENLTLNYGKDFEKISENVIPNDNDIYVINENSHNIFYLKGVKINNNGSVKTYYTNLEKDKEKVDLRYFDGIKIPDGFKYESGKNKDDLIIKNDTTNTQYNWANIEDGIYTLNEQNVSVVDNNNQSKGLVFDSTQNISDLKESIKEFGGFYFNASGNVYYFSVAEDDNWSIVYPEESLYKDKNGDTAYIPAGFSINKLSSLNTIQNGLIIKKGNEKFVWVDIPDEIIKDNRTVEEIENALKAYTSEYRQNGYDDVWIDGCVTMTNEVGKTSKNVYNEYKNGIYESIKANGGFWISQNEFVGTQKTCTEALQNATNYANDIQGRNSCLLFGVEWDLTCKFIENNSNNTKNILNFINDNINSNNKEWTLEFNGTNGVIRTGSEREQVNINQVNSSNNIGYRIIIY